MTSTAGSGTSRQSALQRFRTRLPAIPSCSLGSCASCSGGRFARSSSSSAPKDEVDNDDKPSTSVARSTRSAPWWSCRSEKNKERQRLLRSAMARTTEDVKHLRFWRSVASEFIGVVLLILVGCGSWVQTANDETPFTVRVALAFGLIYAVIIFCVRNVTDAHLNPAITAAMLVTRRMCVIRGVLYIVAQFLGAILGAALVFGLTPSAYRSVVGCTIPVGEISDAQAFGIEFFATFILVFVVFAAYEKTRREEAICAPFIIGLALAALSLFAIPYTGASLNTARTFGPAVVKGVWDHHWIYWFGPLLGGIAGGAIYDLVYSTKSSLTRMRKCMLVFHGSSGTQKQDAEVSDAEMGEIGGKECPHAESDIALHAKMAEEAGKDTESHDGSVGEDEPIKLN